jgi:hypothetical protein
MSPYLIAALVFLGMVAIYFIFQGIISIFFKDYYSYTLELFRTNSIPLTADLLEARMNISGAALYRFYLRFYIDGKECREYVESNESAAQKHLKDEQIDVLILKGFADNLSGKITWGEYCIMYDSPKIKFNPTDKVDFPGIILPEALERYEQRRREKEKY